MRSPFQRRRPPTHALPNLHHVYQHTTPRLLRSSSALTGAIATQSRRCATTQVLSSNRKEPCCCTKQKQLRHPSPATTINPHQTLGTRQILPTVARSRRQKLNEKRTQRSATLWPKAAPRNEARRGLGRLHYPRHHYFLQYIAREVRCALKTSDDYTSRERQTPNTRILRREPGVAPTGFWAPFRHHEKLVNNYGRVVRWADNQLTDPNSLHKQSAAIPKTPRAEASEHLVDREQPRRRRCRWLCV